MLKISIKLFTILFFNFTTLLLMTVGYTLADDYLVVNSADKVGIGTMSPSGKLHVSGGNAIFDGNVGIGTMSPTAKLHINSTPSGQAMYIVGDWNWPPSFLSFVEMQASLDNTFGEITLLKLRNRNVLGDTPNGYFLKAVEEEGGQPTTEFFTIKADGTVYAAGMVGLGTRNPSYRLDVEGYVQAYGYYTGEIIFQKDGKKLWRMFEEEDGLFVENLNTGKISKVFLEDDLEFLKREIIELKEKIANLEKKE